MYEIATGGGVFAAMIVAFITILIGGGIGWWLRDLIAPNGVSTTPAELGRSWAGWMVFIASVSLLSKFIGKLDADSLFMWLLAGGTWVAVAFILGWGYGKFFKFSNSTMSSRRIQSDEPTRTPSITAAAEESAYARAADELENNQIDKATWARAFSESDGDAEKAKARYIAHRVKGEGHGWVRNAAIGLIGVFVLLSLVIGLSEQQPSTAPSAPVASAPVEQAEPARDAATTKAQYSYMQSLYDTNQYVLLADTGLSFLDTHPNDAWTLNILGLVAIASEDYASGVRILGHAVSAAPNDPVITANLANAYRLISDLERARFYYQKALSLEPGNQYALAGLREVEQSITRQATARIEKKRMQARADADSKPSCVFKSVMTDEEMRICRGQ